MKSAFLKAASLLIILTFLAGCNSTIYEIVEVEEPVEIKEEKSPVADIKEDIKDEPKVNDNKFTDKQMVSKMYSIQIGAFNNEQNASHFADESKNTLQITDIYYKNIEGLYKVRTGNYNDKFDALNQLEKIKMSGFTDAFLVELTYYKVEK